MSEVAGAGSSYYNSMGSLFRTRLKASKDKRLLDLASQLERRDAQSAILADVVNPKGFRTLDGTYKVIPGVSFSDNSNLFGALKLNAEINEDNLRRQIDAFAEKRAKDEAIRNNAKNRQNAINEFYKKDNETKKKRMNSVIAANAAYMAEAFGIGRVKDLHSKYSSGNSPVDFRIFGANTGHGTDFINSYTADASLNLQMTSTISMDWDDSQKNEASVAVSSAVTKKLPPAAPATTRKFVVRLTGDQKADPSQNAGSVLASPTGYLTYMLGGTGAKQTVAGSQIAEISEAEFDTLEYNLKFDVGTTGANLAEDYDKMEKANRQDFLSTMVTETTGGVQNRSYIHKTSILKGQFTQESSVSTEDKVYTSKMFIHAGAYFNSATVTLEGNFGTNATSGNPNTAVDLLNAVPPKLQVFAREYGYKTRLNVDLTNSFDNTLALTKTSGGLLSDGLEIFFTIPSSERAGIKITSTSMVPV